ncbi:hypothetical protein [Dorea formicigenerans]|uniref:Ig-like domain-containing protein n=1 Tax=Dorea formicigenerans TaxID=39486 RepID=A0A413SUT5_9FIRM|nr:hypothetical protein [Dorea formicigenerans]RHA72578.1 hypothetical protein DW924_00580 [Dorea formicigenerans]
MKRKSASFLAGVLVASMVATPLSYTNVYAEDQDVAEIVQQVEDTSGESENVQESAPAKEESKEEVKAEENATPAQPEASQEKENTGAPADGTGGQQEAQNAQTNEIATQEAVTPVQPTAAINGVKVLKNDGNIYKMFPTEDAQVTVEEDKMKITFHTGAKKVFDAIYLGPQTDETKNPVIKGTDNGSNYKFTIEVPLSKKNSWIPISVGHYDEGTWSDNYLWMSIPNPGAPVITSEPQSAAVKAGKQVNLSVEADGTDCTYQWQYSTDGTNWTDCIEESAKSANYSFQMKAELAGKYHCVVKNASGEVTSEAADVTVAASGEDGKDDSGNGGNQGGNTGSDSSNDNAYVATGKISAIYASDSEKNPEQIYKMFNIAESEAKIAGDKVQVSIWVQRASSGSFTYDAIYIGSKDDEEKTPLVMGVVDTEKDLEKFTFEVPSSMAGGEVHFVPRNGRTQKFSTSSSLALKLPALDDFKKQTEIVIQSQPKDIAAKNNTQVTLSVTAKGDENVTLSYQWQHSADGTSWADCDDISAKTDTYTFQMAADKAGQYRCVISDSNGTTVTSDIAKVENPSAPTVTGSQVQVVKDNGTPYKMFEVNESKVLEDGDNLNITFSTKNVSYDKIYLGYKEDTIKNPVITGTKLEEGGYTFTFQVSASDKGKVLPLTVGKLDGTWSDKDLWIYIPDEGIESLPTATDEVKTIAGGTGTVSNELAIVSSKAVLRGDKIRMTLDVKGNKWTKIYLGVQADKNKTPVYTGTYDSEKDVTTFTFDVSAEKQGMNIAVTPGNESWFTWARDLFINVPNLENKANTTAEGVYDIYGSAYPTTNVYSLNFERESSVSISGDTATVTWVTQAGSYDRLYIGNPSDSDEVKEANAIVPKDRSDIASGYKSFTFTMPVSELGKEFSYSVRSAKTGQWSTKDSRAFINGILEKTGELPTPDPDPDPGIVVPADGIYKVNNVTSSSSMFNVIDCKLTVKNGKMSAVLTLSGTGYDYLYMGTGAKAAETDKSAWIPYVVDKEGKYTYTVPIETLDKKIAVAAFSHNRQQWYDRMLTFDSNSLEKIGDVPVLENGIYSIDVESSASMFRVVDCKLTSKDGKMSAVLTLSGTGYGYLYMGTKEEAAAADQSSWIPFVADSNGKYTYTIPVEALDKGIDVAAYSIKNAIWYDRMLTFKSETVKKIGDISDGNNGNNNNNGNNSGNNGNNGNNNSGNNGSVLKPNDGKAENESKYEADTSGATSQVNSSTTLADGVYTPDRFTWSGGTGKVKIYCNKITIKNGQAYATLVFDSDHYQYVKANGNTYYTTKGGGTATVTIPVALNQNNKILGMTDKMSVAHEIEYTIFVYLAAAGNGTTLGGVNASKKLDEKAPEIMGLEYQSETQLDYAEYFKIYHYDQGITLLEIDMTKGTANDPEKLAAEAINAENETGESEDAAKDTELNQSTDSKNVKSENAVEEDAAAAGISEDGEENLNGISEEELAAELYKGNVVKYLLVPEGVEVPVGLDQDMIVVQMPTDKTYTSTEAILEKMDELGLTDNIAAIGDKKKDCKVDSVAEKMEKKDGEDKAQVVYGGKEEEPDFKTLVKQETNLALLSSDILPKEADIKDLEENQDKEDSKDTDKKSDEKKTDKSDKKSTKKSDDKSEKKTEKKSEKKSDKKTNEKSKKKSEDKSENQKKLTVKEQTERFQQMTEKFALLGIPVIVDRSEDEQTDLAKYEWIKVYGVLFGCEDQMNTLFDQAVKDAGDDAIAQARVQTEE